MKKLIALVFVLGLFVVPLQAQVDDIITNESGFLKAPVELTDYFSKSIFLNAMQLAIDANSVAVINTAGNYNVTTITQMGENNVGVIKTRGNGNETELIQNGNNLLSLIGIDGNSNTLMVEQIGVGLGNKILLKGTDINFNILQNKSGISIRLGDTSIPLQITHTGGTIPIKISNN